LKSCNHLMFFIVVVLENIEEVLSLIYGLGYSMDTQCLFHIYESIIALEECWSHANRFPMMYT
jgi:hypothetical protein